MYTDLFQMIDTGKKGYITTQRMFEIIKAFQMDNSDEEINYERKREYPSINARDESLYYNSFRQIFLLS